METLTSLIQAARDAERAGAWRDALAYYERAFARVPKEGDARQAADLLRWIGNVHRRRYEIELAEETYEVSRAVAAAGGLDEAEAAALCSLASVHAFRGATDRAERLGRSARELAERAGAHRLIAEIDRQFGALAGTRGDSQAAVRRYEDALRRFREFGDGTAIATVLEEMGRAELAAGRWRAAEASLDEAYALADQERDMELLGTIELARARLHRQRGHYADAREACDRGFELFGRCGSDVGRGRAYRLYGGLYRDTGKLYLAGDHLHQAVSMAHACHDKVLEAEAYGEMALLRLAEGKNRDAVRTLTRADRIYRALDARRELPDRRRRLDRMEALFLRVVSAWAESVESKERYAAGHCERVADYACGLAEAQGVEGRDLVWFRMGSLLHDVGKLAVPTDVLNKAGELTAEERALVRRHTVIGDQVVAGLDLPRDIRPLVRNHHEHWDGTGYPDGLEGEEIPLAARIVCIAEIFDTLTTERGYREALSRAGALRAMERDAGRVVDPTLLATFRRLLEEPPSVNAGRRRSSKA